MADAPTTYSIKKTNVIVGGHFVTGFFDGTIISATKTADDVTPHVGAKGEVTYSENGDETGTITITLKQTSPSLPVLIALAKSKQNFPAQLIDSNTNSIKVGGNYCRILKVPDIEFAQEVSGVEIQIFVADYTMSAS